MTRHVDFTDQFYTDYFTYSDSLGSLYLRMTLTLSNYDYSTWTSTTGGNGIWLGVGFGSQVMADSDIVICTLRFYGEDAGDEFVCTDRYANDNAMPLADSVQNVTYISTSTMYTSSIKRAEFSVTFDRPLSADTTTGEDYQLENGQSSPAIWAFGRMSSGTISSHRLGNDRGTFDMGLSYINTGANRLFGRMFLYTLTLFLGFLLSYLL